MDICNINDIKKLLAKHGFHFSKGLGQNFLCDSSIPEGISEGANIENNTNVVEIGPGIGTLTQQLCKRAKRVVAVELDKRLPPVLEETMQEYDNFVLTEGDVLKTDLKALCAEHFDGGRTIACANLPYYITTPAIAALIGSDCFDSITVMVQKEVAERICAKPGKGDYGAFTVYIAYHAQAEIILNVSRDCFIPTPRVDSAVVHMTLRKQSPECVNDEKMFFRVVKAAFAQRRKTLLNCMQQGFSEMNREEVTEWIESCGISPSCRGETLSLEQFAALANCRL